MPTVRRWRLVSNDGKPLLFFTYGQLMDKINSRTLPARTYRIEHWERKHWRYLSSYTHTG